MLPGRSFVLLAAVCFPQLNTVEACSGLAAPPTTHRHRRHPLRKIRGVDSDPEQTQRRRQAKSKFTMDGLLIDLSVLEAAKYHENLSLVSHGPFSMCLLQEAAGETATLDALGSATSNWILVWSFLVLHRHANMFITVLGRVEGKVEVAGAGGPMAATGDLPMVALRTGARPMVVRPTGDQAIKATEETRREEVVMEVGTMETPTTTTTTTVTVTVTRTTNTRVVPESITTIATTKKTVTRS